MTGTPSNRHVNRPQGDEQPTSDPTSANPAEPRTRDHRALAQQWANEARGADPALGQVYALTAIAHAILATSSEEPR